MDETVRLNPEQLVNFGEKAPQDFEAKQRTIEGNHQRELFKLRERDIEWKIRNRPWFGGLMLFLLFGQNLATFVLIAWALYQGTLDDLSLIFSILTSATLVETAVTVRAIIAWLFSNIDYTRE